MFRETECKMKRAHQRPTSERPIDYIAVDASPLLANVVRAIIDNQTERPSETVAVPATQVPSKQWPNLWQQLVHHRIGSQVTPLINTGAIEILDEPGDRVAFQLKAHSIQVAQLQLKLRAQMVSTVQLLEKNSIEVRVLKGLATSDLDYAEPARRHTSDVDLLVRPKDFKRACEIINQPGVEALKAGEPSQLLVEATFVTSQGLEIDLHHRLFRIGPANDHLLFDQPDQLPNAVGQALKSEARLLHAAGHLLLSPPGHRRLSSLIDVAILSSVDYVNVVDVLELAESFGLADIVKFALWIADNVGQPTPSEIPRAPNTVINRAHIRVGRSPALETAAVLADLGSTLDRLTYLRYQASKHMTALLNRRTTVHSHD